MVYMSKAKENGKRVKVTNWKIGKNACETPWCTRRIGDVWMAIFEGINGEPCSLNIHGDSFINNDRFELSKYDFITASKEADEIYRSEIKQAIIYLQEQLSLMSKIKFFEFKNYPYFAMICAETEQEAIKCYQEEVCDIDEENGPPNEITEEDARIKYLSHSKSEHEQELSEGEFEEYLSDSKPCVLLIDSCLV